MPNPEYSTADQLNLRKGSKVVVSDDGIPFNGPGEVPAIVLQKGRVAQHADGSAHRMVDLRYQRPDGTVWKTAAEADKPVFRRTRGNQ